MISSLDLKNYYLKELQCKSQHTKNAVQRKNCKRTASEKNIEEAFSQSKKPVEVVVFKKHKRKIPVEPATSDTEIINDDLGFNSSKLLSKLQWDVTSFGLQGFTKEKKRKFEQERAIKLGAKPKKREYINYKVLTEERKKQKLSEDQSQEQEAHRKKHKKQSLSASKSVFWKDTSKVEGFGPIGKYKDGVLTISSHTLKRR